MPSPEISNTGGIYIFRWVSGDQSGLAIRVDKVREDSRTGVTGEINIKFGATGHIHMTRYSLLSTRSRNDVSRFCESRLQGFDWSAILELVSIKTVEIWRAGEPVLILGNVPISEHLEYRMYPLLVEESPNLIYGEGGLGKSYLAACVGVMIQEAVVLGPMIPEPGPVLYLDYETNPQIAARRFRMIHRGLNLESAPNIYYRFCYLPLAHDVDEIQRAIVDRSIALVIVDSAGPACGGEPESAAATIQFFTALRSLRVTSLIIAHKSKVTGGVGPFGSVYWLNYPRNVYEIKRVQEPGESTMHLALLHRKANEGILLPPTGVRLTFLADAVEMDTESVGDVPEFGAEVPLAARIKSELSRGALTVKQLAEELETTEGSIRNMLNRYKGTRFTQVETNLGIAKWGNL